MELKFLKLQKNNLERYLFGDWDKILIRKEGKMIVVVEEREMVNEGYY